ncbi:MAG TPA: hypothetical protein VLW85_09070 [Myxococcales bacterium]|nr:hypothetical protein [Myxococcales bacterium]
MSRATLALCVAVLAACGGNSTTPSDAGGKTCELSSDCTGTDVCVNKVCVPICHQTSDCASQGSGLVCEEGICVAPACGSDAECGSQACIGGACRTPTSSSEIASCEVTPSPGDVHTGSAGIQLKAVALDSSGKAVVWNKFTWVASAGTIDASGNLVTSAAGDVNVTATVTGTSKTCNSTVHSYAAAGANIRVTVINQLDKTPVQNAQVLVCDHPAGNSASCPADPDSTGSDGTVTVTATGHPSDVHVFAVGYNYTSFISTTATDLLVPIVPYVSDASRSYFTSHMCDATKTDDPANGDAACPPEGDFTPLADQGQAVHLAFMGSGIPNSLLDISVDTLVGPLHPVTITIAGTTKTVNLPYGLVLGIGSDFFGTNDYRVFTDPGVRALWGLGGNLNLSSVVSIITPLLNNSTGGNIDIGTLLPQVLGFVGNLQAGAVVGVNQPAPGTADNSKPVALDSKMRLQANITSPKLPTLDGVYLDGVIAIVGAMDYPIGFVPLGITAGLSAQDNSNPGAVLDPTCDTSGGKAPCETNKVPMKFAPKSGGTEGSKTGVALLAVNFGGLTPGSTAKVAISGQIVVPSNDIPYTAPGSTPPTIAPPNFLALPQSTSVTASHLTRNLVVTGDANDASVAQVYRFEIESSARLTWSVWMPPVGAGAPTQEVVHLPDVPDAVSGSCDATQSLCDPFVQSPTARLLSLQLDGVTSPENIETFGDASGVRIDEIGAALKAFTALQVDVE